MWIELDSRSLRQDECTWRGAIGVHGATSARNAVNNGGHASRRKFHQWSLRMHTLVLLI